MNKITADHLARRACVYIRQSTPQQVRHNLESQRRQYGLVDRARALGWQDIDVIDDDLGISGSGIRRPGFERLLSVVCDKQVGAVFSIEASRLARTNREWHTLLEFCSIVGVLLIDAEAVYDPRLTNDSIVVRHEGHHYVDLVDVTGLALSGFLPVFQNSFTERGSRRISAAKAGDHNAAEHKFAHYREVVTLEAAMGY